ncbi:MAG: RNA polymerase sigma factor, partial [Planctomycetota bacterium]
MTRRQLEQLLRHERFLRALARRLLQDATRADDVVQEAWLVALRSRKSPQQVRRSWLAGVVRNLVRRTRREEARRARRERIAAQGGAERSTDELFGERMVRRRIAELVLGLPERYREPVLLRFYDGLRPLDIAERLGVAGSTVRTRLRRGLARIRRRLEAEHGGGRGAIRALLGVVAAAALPRRAAAAPGRTAGTLSAGAAALLVALCVARLGPAPRGGRVALGPRAAGTGEVTGAVPGGGKAARDRRAAEATAPEPTATAARGVVTGVVRLPRGVARRRVLVELAAVRDGRPDRSAVVRHTVAADRTFRLALDRFEARGLPESVRLSAFHP